MGHVGDRRQNAQRRGWVALVLGLLLLCGAPRDVAAQNQIMKASLVGTVSDAQGLAVPGASIEIMSADGTRSWSVVTDATGQYSQYGLDPGTYRVEARLSGFSDFRSGELVLLSGQTITLGIQLSLGGVVEQVTVTPAVSERRTDYSSPANYITAEQIASLNTPTVEDVVNYQPGVVVRRRYIGDANGTLGMRGSNMFQTARAMVFADGVPLHNPLQTRWNGAPRWSLVAPDEVESAEVVYGPFSAEYAGNSMGGVVKFNTRMPERRELRVDGNLFGQTYAFEGADDRLGGGRSTVSYGDRFGKLSISVLHNHLQNASQPQNFAIDDTGLRAPSGQPETAGAAEALNYRGVPSIIYGDEGKDEVRSDLLKVKIAHEHTPTWNSRWTMAYEDRRDQNQGAVNYLETADGRPLWGDGNNSTKDAISNGQAFNVRNDFFGLSDRSRRSLFVAWDAKGQINGDWVLDATVSRFAILEDIASESAFNPADPLNDGSGTITAYDNTGWSTFDVKLRDSDFLSRADLTFVAGYHFSANEIELAQYRTLDYGRRTRDRQTNDSGGKTSIHGLFAQLGWRLHQDWELTLGGRQEFWRARDGFARTTSLDLSQEDRNLAKFSPKASIGWEPADRFRLQYSVARAYRFPVVEELFDNQIRTFGTVLGDAGLDPEAGIHHNVSVQRGLGDGHLEVNYFRDDVDDTIFTQFQFIQGASIFSFLPIDQVTTNGLEVVVDQRRLFDSRVDLQVNTTFTGSTIVKHSLQPALEGNIFPRMPKVRVGAYGVYHLSPAWQTSLGLRYVSDQFGDLDNGDSVDGVFGAMDSYLFLDFKVSYELSSGSRFSFGIDNLANRDAFVFHPWPGRTFFGEFSVDVLNGLLGDSR